MVEFPEKFAEEEITCPYCGEEFGDSYEFGESGEHYEDCEECPNCEKKFTWTRNISVNYTSSPDCKLNNEEHKFGGWKLFDHDSNYSTGRTKGRKKTCSICGEIEYEFDKD